MSSGSSPSPDPDPMVLIRQLDRACRFGFLTVAGLFTYFVVRMAFTIPNFEAVFKDMLNGKELPILTQIIFKTQPIIILLILILPVFALVSALKIKRADHSIIAISMCSAGIFLIGILLWWGLTAPFFSIIQELTSNV